MTIKRVMKRFFTKKTGRLTILNILLFFFLAVFISCMKKSATPPAVTTDNISGLTKVAAVSGGDVTNDGGATVESRGVCWSTSASPTISDNKTEDGTGVGAFASDLTTLTANTMYFVRAYATNSAGTSYGNQVTFTTPQTSLATLTTDAVSMITEVNAVSGGNITSDGGEAVTARGLCWGISMNPTVSDPKTTDGSGIGTFSDSLTKLSPNTTYFIRSYAINGLGTAYGNQVSFTTAPVSTGSSSVSIAGIAFNPQTITVTAGTTITWTNNDGVSHTVTSDTSLFDSGTISPGGTYSHTFATTGTFAYHCKFHPGMMGSVIVN